MELKVNKKLLIKNLIEYNMEFYIPSYLIRNYSDDEEVVKVIDWSRNSESYLNFRVQIEGHYNKASSTGDYYIISSRLEDFIDYLDMMRESIRVKCYMQRKDYKISRKIIKECGIQDPLNIGVW